MPSGSADPTFKHPELMAEGHDLSLKLRIRLAGDDQDFQEESNDGAGGGKEHERRESHARPERDRWPPSATRPN